MSTRQKALLLLISALIIVPMFSPFTSIVNAAQFSDSSISAGSTQTAQATLSPSTSPSPPVAGQRSLDPTFGGGEPGSFSMPQGVATDSNGNVYVVDSINQRVEKFDSSGNLLATYQVPFGIITYQVPWGTSGTLSDDDALTGIAVDKDGYIYLSAPGAALFNSPHGDRILLRLSPDGTTWTCWPMKWVCSGWPGYEVSDVYGLAVDNNGYLYGAAGHGTAVKYNASDGSGVAYSGQTLYGYNFGDYNSYGVVYDGQGSLYVSASHQGSPVILQLNVASGDLIHSWALDSGTFPAPGAIGIALGASGLLYLVDPSVNKVFTFNPADGTTKTLTNLGSFAAPGWVAAGSNGNLYVSDMNLDRVYIINSASGLVTSSFGSSSLGGGSGVGVAVDAQNRIYTADGGPQGTNYARAFLPYRVSVFNQNGSLTARWGASLPPSDYPRFAVSIFVDLAGNIYAVFDNGGYGGVTIEKFDQTGKQIGTLSLGNYVYVTIDGQGLVYAVGWNANLVNTLWVYDSSFNLLSSCPLTATPDGNNNAGLVAYGGNVYVLYGAGNGTYGAQSTIYKYTTNGTLLGSFVVGKDIGGLAYYNQGRIAYLNNLAADAMGNFYVNDQGGSNGPWSGTGTVWILSPTGAMLGQIGPIGFVRSVAPGAGGVYIATGGSSPGVHYFPFSQVSGVVKDTAGNPVANVTVKAESAGFASFSAITDATGGYSMYLPDGNYTFAAISPLNSSFAFQWYQNQYTPRGATILTVPLSQSVDFALPATPLLTAAEASKISVAGRTLTPTTTPYVNVHQPFTISYTVGPNDCFFTSGEVMLDYPDGTVQDLPMTITETYPGSLYYTIKTTVDPPAQYTGFKETMVHIRICLKCGVNDQMPLFGSGRAQQLAAWQAAQDGLSSALAGKAGVLISKTGKDAAGYAEAFYHQATGGQFPAPTSGWAVPDPISYAQTGADVAGWAYLKLRESMQLDPTKEQLIKNAVDGFRGWFQNNEYNHLITKGIGGVPLPAPYYPCSPSNLIDSQTGQIKNYDGAYSLMGAVAQYLEARGRFNNMVPAYTGDNINPLLPNYSVPISNDPNDPHSLVNEPTRLLESLFGGHFWDTSTSPPTLYEGSQDKYWQTHPLNQDDLRNIAELICKINDLYNTDGTTLKCKDQCWDYFIVLTDPSGVVTDNVTGLPVSGASVTLSMLNQLTGSPQLVTDPGLFLPSVNPETTDSHGAYAWDVAPGSYSVQVQAAGYQSANSTWVTVPPPVTNLNVSLIPLPKPVTTLSVASGKTGNNGWYTSNVTLNLASTDSVGLKEIHYVIDSSAEQVIPVSGNNASTSFSMSGDGVHTVSYWSVGADGFVEATHTFCLGIDTTPPSVYLDVTNPYSGFIPTVWVSNDTSGVSAVQATLDGSTYSLGSPITSSGNHTLAVTATDLAGNVAQQSASFVVAPSIASTTTTVTSSVNPSVYGQVVTFTANVTAMTPGAGTPTGTVQFSDNGTSLGTPLALGSDGTATYSTSSLSLGSHNITAAYSGDANFSASTSAALTQIVNKAMPTVTTAAITGITPITATGGGNVTSDGGASVTVRGVCWSTSANPTTTNGHTSDGTGIGTFVSSITGLTPNTPYHVRAYATNSVGTAYGNDVQFTTSRPPVAVCKDAIVSADNNCKGSASIDNGSYDPDGNPITITQSPSGPYSLGSTVVTLTVTDSFGVSSSCTGTVTVADETPPTVTIKVPQNGTALRDDVTLIAEAPDACGVAGVYFYIREPGGTNGVPIGYEDLPGTYNSTSGQWEYNFDTTKVLDGYYVILARAVDTSGNEGWSAVVPFSIRNWVVIKLLPATENNNTGRTMPVKFSLRIASSVDPNQPFVYNEDLEIRIYKTSNPGIILQKSLYGTNSTDYRIDTVGELYITNFKTGTTPAQYSVEIWRINKNWLVGSFTFKTVK